MTRNIDELADRSRDTTSPAESLEQSFLRSRPDSQWPSYLDETAKDLVAGIEIGETGLDKSNFPREVGPVYSDGLVAATDAHSDLPAALSQVGHTDLGRAVFLLNRLEYEISRSDTGLENTQRAVSAVLEKILSETAESRVTPYLGEESNSTADIMIQMLSDPDVASRVETVLEEFEAAYHSGLLAKLDKPQMMTPLWEHQRDALGQWLERGGRGYVDMATATGKTVLGLAAIAAQYGSLHPLDADLDPERDGNDGRDDVLVVAHSDLILEQWRREFDRHLNIPSDRTQGTDVDLTWGCVHFRTAQTLLNQDRVDYDLVVLDEAHHYASGTGWGQLLEEFDDRVLALSGSVDSGLETASRVRDRLESTVGPECKRYTLAEAQRDGVIPTFDWYVEYTATAGDDGEFVEISKRAQTLFEDFADRDRRGELDIETDRRVRTFDDVRRYSHTSEGESLKQRDDQFRDLVTALFSRRTQRWNQSPTPDTVVDVVERYLDAKVVVLTNNNAQVESVADGLRDRLDGEETPVYTVTSDQTSQQQRDTVDEFDVPGTPAVLVGTGDLLGEGVDMQHAEVGVNMATGSVNKQLIQRIGRVLRNPGADKTAAFVNLVGLPVERDAQVPREDGQQLVEDAAQFKRFGRSFDNSPAFTVSAEPERAGVGGLLDGGHDRITALDEAGCYEWADGDDERETLRALLTAISDCADVDAVLAAWTGDATEPEPNRVEPARGERGVETADDGRDGDEANRPERTDSLTITVVDGSDGPVEGAFVSVAGDSVAAYGRTDGAGEVSFSGVRGECVAGIHAPDGGVRTVDIEPETGADSDLTVEVGLTTNP